MNEAQGIEREAASAFRTLFQGFRDFRVLVHSFQVAQDRGLDALIDVRGPSCRYSVEVEARSRVTPQIALAICAQSARQSSDEIRAVYAPVISPRVAEILRGSGIGYLDRAGNCWLQKEHHPLLIERRGFKAERAATPAAVDPFSTKSSRIIRQMLTQPMQAWQIRQLATHPDVGVSLGLVVKVKRALIEEGYAIESDRRLIMRDAIGLLNAWAQKYPGPAEQVPVYVRGDAANAEWVVHEWCVRNQLQHALCGFSAAWRLAPEVRYNVGSLYLADEAFENETFERLMKECGLKRVGTGHNLSICRPFDPSVFAAVPKGNEPKTSALQTYLDLRKSPARGEEAAQSVFEKYLSLGFALVAEREEERRRAGP